MRSRRLLEVRILLNIRKQSVCAHTQRTGAAAREHSGEISLAGSCHMLPTGPFHTYCCHSTAGYLNFHPAAQCVVHALKGLARGKPGLLAHAEVTKT